MNIRFVRINQLLVFSLQLKKLIESWLSCILLLAFSSNSSANIGVKLQANENHGYFWGFGADIIGKAEYEINTPFGNKVDISGEDGYGLNGYFGYKKNVNAYKLVLGFGDMHLEEKFNTYTITYGAEYKRYIKVNPSLYTRINILSNKIRIDDLGKSKNITSDIFIGYQYPIGGVKLGVEAGYQLLSKIVPTDFTKEKKRKTKVNLTLSW